MGTLFRSHHVRLFTGELPITCLFSFQNISQYQTTGISCILTYDRGGSQAGDVNIKTSDARKLYLRR